MGKKWKKKIYKDSSRTGGYIPPEDSHYDPNSKMDRETGELKSDPFHYGRHKYANDTERELVAKRRSRDSYKYGSGSVVGAGSLATASQEDMRNYKIVNKPPAESDSYKAILAYRQGASQKAIRRMLHKKKKP